MMTMNEIREVQTFESTVQIGQTVQVHFTDFCVYRGPATVVRVSPKSFSVTLDQPLGEGAHHKPAGARVTVPRHICRANGWSYNNALHPQLKGA